MSIEVAELTKPALALDYSLTGVNSKLAIEKGLAEADWYQCAVPRGTMRQLLERRDGPAIWNTLLWVSLILASAAATVLLWGTWWVVIPYALYSVLYASTSDSRWHETGHGTAFKTDWMNNALYEVASFMVMRESTLWRWSHTRHHSDTIIVGRDPEISVPRPPNVKKILSAFFNLPVYPSHFKQVVLHAAGRMSANEKTFVPEDESPKVFLRARIYLTIYLSVIGISIGMHSLLPLMLVGLTNIFGSWLMVVYGLTQHSGLAENVLDHRLNCRTVYMNPIHRFLYWNMNYHVEHHMFPLVPYHALPRLHEAIKADCAEPYPSLLAAWREIIPAVLKQVKDPAYHVKRRLPEAPACANVSTATLKSKADPDGWVDVCGSADLCAADVLRFDYGKKTFALYRDENSKLFATDGICTHGNVHLAGGLVKGGTIECPKHNGRFHLVDGSPARVPVCRGIATYPIQEQAGRVTINVEQPGGAGARETKSTYFRVLSNRSVSTFIKELEIAPLDGAAFPFAPGDYVQLNIPAFDAIHFADFDIPEPYASVWNTQHLFDLVASNRDPERRNNYSIASNYKHETSLRFNVRIATPPPGQDCGPGAGSSYLFNLKPGNIISGIGPFGDFHIKPTQKEIVYIGGGAGMAPLRAHLSHLLETEGTARRISFWYGARSKQEVFYDRYFEALSSTFANFKFQIALSSPLEEDHWTGSTGFIHDVVFAEHLRNHTNVGAVEFYLCGPPMMIKACTKMLAELGVPSSNIAYDEF